MQRQSIHFRFSGSFTTSTVAVRLGRKAIGIDLNEEYFEIGIRRGRIVFYNKTGRKQSLLPRLFY